MNRLLPPLTAIKAFEAAARHENYRKAAAELLVSPAAISQQVALLEDYLDVKLFARMSNKIQLTAAGRSFLPLLTQSLDQIAQASLRIRSERIKGSVKLGVLPAMAVHWLIPRLAQFNQQFPDLTLSVHTTPNVSHIMDDDVDITIHYCDGRVEGMHTFLLMRESVFPICSPKLMGKTGGLNSIRDISKYTLIHDIDGRRQQPWLGWEYWIKKLKLNIHPEHHPGFEFRDSISVMHATINGLGVALGRSALIGDLLETGQLVRPFKVHLTADYGYYIAVSEKYRNKPEIKAVIDWLLSQAKMEGALSPRAY